MLADREIPLYLLSTLPTVHVVKEGIGTTLRVLRVSVKNLETVALKGKDTLPLTPQREMPPEGNKRRGDCLKSRGVTAEG